MPNVKVLTLQGNHRSEDIWEGRELDNCVRTRRLDNHFWQFIQKRPLHPRIVHYFELSGFRGLLHVGRIHYDRALTTALLERWRPETNTFHFRCGEATITLQDIEVLFGLPVDGLPVVSFTRETSVDSWIGEIEKLTGFRPLPTQFDGTSRLSLQALENYIKGLSPITLEDSEEVVHMHFRAYVIWLFGGTLFPDCSGVYVRLNLVPLLGDVEAIASYSWGSAVLAYTYWALCRASIKGSRDFYGFTGLVQTWAWERIRQIQPAPRTPPEGAFFTVHAQRWTSKIHLCDNKFSRLDRDKATFPLPVYRDMFDGMTPDKFVWQPYNGHLERLSARCSRGMSIWMAEVPILCGEIVAHHLPGRVLRQFGCRQTVPSDFEYDLTLFMRDLRHKLAPAYKSYLEYVVSLWDDRAEKVVHAEPFSGIVRDDDPYMRWYRKISRPLIGNPAHDNQRGYQAYVGKHEALARGLHCIYRIAGDMQNPDDLTTSQEWGMKIADIASEALLAARQGERLSFDPDYQPVAAYDHCDPVNLRRGVAREGRGRGRRGRGAAREAAVDHRLVDEDDDPPMQPSVAPLHPNAPSLMDPQLDTGESSHLQHDDGGGSLSFMRLLNMSLPTSPNMPSEDWFSENISLDFPASTDVHMQTRNDETLYMGQNEMTGGEVHNQSIEEMTGGEVYNQSTEVERVRVNKVYVRRKKLVRMDSSGAGIEGSADGGVLRPITRIRRKQYD